MSQLTVSWWAIPPGDYEIEAWHDRLVTRTEKKILDAMGSLDVEFLFKN